MLTVIQGPDRGRVFQLPAHEPQLIGRSSEALPISDNTVSRRHAELTPDDGEWWIRDLSSQNGTWLNGVRIEGRVKLRPGDQVRVGGTIFVFGQSSDAGADLLRVLPPDEIDADIEHKLASNEDSVILGEPEPRSAAAEHLRVIYRLTTLTTQVSDREDLLEKVMDLVFTEFKPERGCIMLALPGGGTGGPPPAAGAGAVELAVRPAVVKYRTPPRDPDDAQFQVSRTILHLALSQSEGVLSSNAMGDPRFAAGDSVHRFKIRSAVCSPIRFRDRVYGVVYIDTSLANAAFTPGQLALLNAIGQHTGLALATLELHQQKLQAQRLAAVGETVASLSHSIKNILQGLRGGADVVEMGLKREDLKIALGGWAILKRNLDRIMALALNMLAYSRQRRVEVELTRLGPLIDECVQLLEGQCQARKVALIVDADPEMPPVPIDPHLVHQALMNLITNAVEAVPASTGVVTVRAAFAAPSSARGRTGTPMVEVAVIDNGPGIPRERQHRIFEPFYTTKGLRGTGLGLAVAQRVAEEHGGRIEVESAEGHGATFRLLLPADVSGGIDPSATASQKPGAGEARRGL